MDLHHKTVLLTGATGGIGHEIASLIAADWGELILVGRNKKKLAELAQKLTIKSVAIVADLSSRGGRERLIKTLKRKHLNIDILINGAGVGIYKDSAKFTEKEWYGSYELNVHSPFFLWEAIRPKLAINIGSCSALQYKANRSLYNSTKAAFRSLTLCLEDEYPGELVHITLDSTLTSFGSLTLAEKKVLAKKGKQYLDPRWVAKQIMAIIKDDKRDGEYLLSPDCYEACGNRAHWLKPTK